ncbi:MAG: FAD-linked oxidoreductase, partial [Moraxellaceae bacterium]|nr:FAD-linked oxidoreductase [Moraxellaceae bacterium]
MGNCDQPPSPERRRFLAQAGALGLAAGTGLLLPRGARAAEQWQNWSGGQKAAPAQLLYPNSETALVEAVRKATGSIRAVGGSHSFSPVVNTNGTIISLEALNGLVAHDAQALTATFRAGTRVASTGAALKEIGQGLLNEADINMQSLGGAISTATHGTGRALKSYSGNVTALRLVTADGSVVDCSATQERELFDAARVAIGSLGILSRVTLQNRAAYRLRETVEVMDIGKAVSALERERDQHRHMEFFAFPFGGKAIVKRMNITTDAPTQVALEDDNGLLDFAADTARRFPWTNPWIQRLVGAFISDSERASRPCAARRSTCSFPSSSATSPPTTAGSRPSTSAPAPRSRCTSTTSRTTGPSSSWSSRSSGNTRAVRTGASCIRSRRATCARCIRASTTSCACADNSIRAAASSTTTRASSSWDSHAATHLPPRLHGARCRH